MTLSFARFLEASSGKVLADAANMPAWFRPSTDSRTIERGETFVCLRGPHFDGHEFIAAALARGAAALVVDDADRVPRGPSVPVVSVTDAKAAYVAGAAAARQLYRGQLIAITGSSGKTTTKEFTAQILGRHLQVVATPANENNELGVAKLCYRLGDGVDVAIAEYGARKPGDIEQLVNMAPPSIGVLTGVGEAHLEFYRDKEQLARTKYALFSHGARAVCSAADAWSRMLAAEAGNDAATLWIRMVGDPVMVGIMLEAGEVQGERVAVTFGASHAFASWRVPGTHNLRDALLAAGASILAGMTFEDAIGALGDLRLPAGRFETHELPGGASAVYDAYNASPGAVLESLRTFVTLPATRRIAVLGSMAELGAQADALHREVGLAAARLGLDEVYCGGPHANDLAAGLREGGLRSVHTYASNEEIAQRLRAMLRSGDRIFLKGSRVEKMEEILVGLQASGAVTT